MSSFHPSPSFRPRSIPPGGTDSEDIPLTSVSDILQPNPHSPTTQPSSFRHYYHRFRVWFNYSKSRPIRLIIFILFLLILIFIALWITFHSHSNSTTDSVNTQSINTPDDTISFLLSSDNNPDPSRIWTQYLPPLLITRVPGTESHDQARDFIVNTLKQLNWTVELDSFIASTPYGDKPMHNIIATRFPNATKRMILSAHYDSKYFSDFQFIGATDSAAPCAILLEVATILKPTFDIMTDNPDTTLQLTFFDGEEAWVRWTETDSVYGSRHLAEKWFTETLPSSNLTKLQSISVLILLDLLGAPNTTIFNLQARTADIFTRLVHWESQLRSPNHLNLFLQSKNSNNSVPYFYPDPLNHAFIHSGIDDDHREFLRRDVPIVHLIPAKFPAVWHAPTDNIDALDRDTIINLSRIMVALCVDLLHLHL